MSSSGKWILGLFILLTTVVQSFVWYVAFVNAGNGSALNFVSFAGTLISIILAVLAIGYTYGESISQKSKGDSLSGQIAALTEIASGMRVQAEAWSEVSNIKTELESVALRIENGFSETRDNVSFVSSAIGAVSRRFDEINLTRSAPFSVSALDKTEVARAFMAARTPLMEVSILIIAYWLDVKKISITSSECNEGLREIVSEAAETGCKIYRPESEVVDLFCGSVLSIASALEGVGLVVLAGNKKRSTSDASEEALSDELEMPALSDELRLELIRTVISTPMRSGPFYAAMRVLVVSRLQADKKWIDKN